MQNAPIQQQPYFNQLHLLQTIDGLIGDLETSHKQIPKTPGVFYNNQVTTLHRRLSEVRKIIAEVKETEWHKLTERIRAKEASKGVQAAIFH